MRKQTLMEPTWHSREEELDAHHHNQSRTSKLQTTLTKPKSATTTIPWDILQGIALSLINRGLGRSTRNLDTTFCNETALSNPAISTLILAQPTTTCATHHTSPVFILLKRLSAFKPTRAAPLQPSRDFWDPSECGWARLVWPMSSPSTHLRSYAGKGEVTFPTTVSRREVLSWPTWGMVR